MKRLLKYLGFTQEKKESKNIKLDSLVNCLGHSINSKEFIHTIKELECSKIDESWDIRNQQNTFRISFNHKSDYLNRIGIPQNLTTSLDNEPIVYYIIFKDLNLFKNKTPNLELPFSLNAGNTKEEVHKKIGIKPYDKQKIYLPEMKEGSLEYFDCPNFQVQAWYDNHNCLFELMFNQITLEERSKIEFEKKIKQQKKNILPEFAERVESSKKEIPDLTYRNIANKELSKKIKKELLIFIENCSKYTKSRNPKAIINSVKKTVEKINEINCEGIGIIETIERETICEFINDVVKRTGFQNSEEIDITEEWREW